MEEVAPNTPVFRVELKCKNCGHRWFVDCRKYDSVGYNVVGKVRIYNKKTKELRIVECPVCGLTKTVKIEDRRPLEPI